VNEHHSFSELKEYTIAYANGSLCDTVWSSEGQALMELTKARRDLKEMGVPEEFHPVLMVRTREVVVGSWKPSGE
jgi:hypothetical protein